MPKIKLTRNEIVVLLEAANNYSVDNGGGERLLARAKSKLRGKKHRELRGKDVIKEIKRMLKEHQDLPTALTLCSEKLEKMSVSLWQDRKPL